MTCEECKICWNYKVCENGCYGSDKPCEHYIDGEPKDGEQNERTD